MHVVSRTIFYITNRDLFDEIFRQILNKNIKYVCGVQLCCHRFFPKFEALFLKSDYLFMITVNNCNSSAIDGTISWYEELYMLFTECLNCLNNLLLIISKFSQKGGRNISFLKKSDFCLSQCTRLKKPKAAEIDFQFLRPIDSFWVSYIYEKPKISIIYIFCY